LACERRARSRGALDAGSARSGRVHDAVGACAQSSLARARWTRGYTDRVRRAAPEWLGAAPANESREVVSAPGGGASRV